jgi:hypothetical protein
MQRLVSTILYKYQIDLFSQRCIFANNGSYFWFFLSDDGLIVMFYLSVPVGFGWQFD